MRVVVTGAGGMVGKAVSEYCASRGDVVFSYDHKTLDISDADRVFQVIENDKPDVIINCAAWTDVDGCEFDEQRAYAANAQGPENLAEASRRSGALFITISTDYVFDGRKSGFYTQDDIPNPESVYAASKLEGERRAQLIHKRTLVVRTGYVFGPGGNNFLSTIIERGRNNPKVKAIGDAFGTPTYAGDLAVRLRELAEKQVPGIYHVVNSGEGVSFEGFTRLALELDGRGDIPVEAISDDSLQRAAKRPRNSRMRCLRSGEIGLPPLRDWRSALEEFVRLQQ